MTELFEFLKRYKLTSFADIREVVARFTDSDFDRFFTEYRELIKRRPLPKPDRQKFTNIYPDRYVEQLSFSLIKQFAIYAKTIYLHDPLLKLANSWETQFGKHLPGFYTSPKQTIESHRIQLASTVANLLRLRHLIEADIVCLITLTLPIDLPNPNNIYLHDFYGPDGRVDGTQSLVLPPKLQEYFDQNVGVYSGRIVNGQISHSAAIQLDDPHVRATDKIVIEIRGEPVYWPYHLATVSLGEADGEIRMFFDYRDNVAVERDRFLNWARDKRNEVIRIRLGTLRQDITFSSILNANFLTNLNVSRDILTRSVSMGTNTHSNVISALIHLELPFFEQATAKSIVQARRNEAAFTEFVFALEDAIEQARSLPQSKDYQANVNQIVDDLLRRQVIKINNQMKILKRSMFRKAGIIAAASFSAFILNDASQSFLASALISAAAAVGIDKLMDREGSEITQNPSFFYWEVTHKK